MVENALISICIPTYNGAAYIQDALNSVKLQTFRDFEVIISDDNSSDNTLEICRKFKSEVDFPVHIYNHNPKGIGANWNNCLNRANGKYIKFLFQDDQLVSECLEKMIATFINDPTVNFVACKRTLINESDSTNPYFQKMLRKYGNLQAAFEPVQPCYTLTKAVFGHDDFLESPLNKIGEPSVCMFKRDLVQKIGLFSETLTQILDYEYWYRVLLMHDITIINESLVLFRLHEQQASNKNSTMKLDESKYYRNFLYKYCYPYLSKKNQQILAKNYRKSTLYSYIKNIFVK